VSINIDIASLLAANPPPGTRALIEAIEASRQSKLIVLVLADNSLLAGDVVSQIESLLLSGGPRDRLDLFLRSTGGIAEIPWRIVSVLREFSHHLGVIVPRVAMSGATHIAIAGDELVLGPLSNLGSVDPTRNHPLLPRDPQGNPIPMSVQNLKHCLGFLTRTLREGEQLGPIVTELFNHVDPLALGALEEAYELARLITGKVLATRRAPIESDRIERIKEKLAGEYFSHAYCISRSEVESDLGLPVSRMDVGQEIFNRVEALHSVYFGAFGSASPVGGPVPLSFRITGFVETTEQRHILCQVMAPSGQRIAGSWIAGNNS
jgi:hypothetical protein